MKAWTAFSVITASNLKELLSRWWILLINVTQAQGHKRTIAYYRSDLLHIYYLLPSTHLCEIIINKLVNCVQGKRKTSNIKRRVNVVISVQQSPWVHVFCPPLNSRSDSASVLDWSTRGFCHLSSAFQRYRLLRLTRIIHLCPKLNWKQTKDT